MYPEAFGLKQPSFSITPDPSYLFLSKRHQEALAHLLYGAEHDGFVLLTGEVGTGKTTICRAFLQQLPQHVTVALILNPAVSAVELLQAICKEFQIEVPPDTVSIQMLNERLNEYLLLAHAQGRRPVLLIDEAQGLQPEVLEQVRLLTNLETETNKLLQIFLVGQPELRELLNQDQLRQVSQRITARFHLSPLSAQETAIYIQHRLAVAGATRRIFTNGAMRQIYRATKGIPRLINILCDRSLLGAYATHKTTINKKLVKRAFNELHNNVLQPKISLWRIALALLIILTFTVGIVLGVHFDVVKQTLPTMDLLAAQQVIQDFITQVTKTSVDTPQIPVQTMPPPASTVVTKSQLPEIPVMPEMPVMDNYFISNQTAMQLLLQNWKVPLDQNLFTEYCIMAQQTGLYCRNSTESWGGLKRYNYPAILKLNSTNEQANYALVLGLDQNQVLLATETQQNWFPRNMLQPLWSGSFVILWRPPFGGYLLIDRNSSKASIKWLQIALKQALKDDTITEFDTNSFDIQLEMALLMFQTQYGLQADGIAGPETLICLSNIANVPNIPKLRQP